MAMTIGEKRKRLFISFSGGKTSAYMTSRLLRDFSDQWDEIVVLFANTGEEHEATLSYVDRCDAHYGFNVVWVEAAVNPKAGVGTKHRVVDFKTASRNGSPFEEVIKKYGLPNTQFPHCTRETKLKPMRNYIKSLGWEIDSYNTAIGLRADEMDRISPPSVRDGAIYPLIEWGVTKSDVLSWELQQPVRLGIPEHQGNCVWCWKKSFRKLATVALETPRAFDFPAMLEVKYKDAGPGFGDRRIFRSRKLTSDIFAMAKDPAFEPFVDGFPFKDESMDFGASCGETCEIGADGPRDSGFTEEVEFE